MTTNPSEPAKSTSLVPGKILYPFILLTSCFAWWGLANNMTDTLLAAFKRIMSMSDFQTSLIQIAFYGSYFCFAIPGALFIRKFNYKAGVLLGLGMFIAGGLLFYPASLTMNYNHFLIALYILAGGLSILETSANPYVISIGPEATATQRLNLAQSFNPLGSISGVVISKFFILSQLVQLSASERASLDPAELKDIQLAELSAVMGPYVAVAFGLLIIWLLILTAKMPTDTLADKDHDIHLGRTVKRLIKNRNYVMGVVAQFFYVGAQICVWSFTIRYVMQALDVNEDMASSYYIAALILFSVSRFICTGLMSAFSPGKILITLAILAIVMTGIVIVADGMVGVIALVGISGCMSLMFPTIYGLGLRGLKGDTKIGGSGQIMAILGGAVITAVMGQVSDASGNIHLSFIVPMFCFVVVTIYGLISIQKKYDVVTTTSK
ncbi:MAG: L-fucose:H+ symporter permease [Bacteroidota bacterium]